MTFTQKTPFWFDQRLKLGTLMFGRGMRYLCATEGKKKMETKLTASGLTKMFKIQKRNEKERFLLLLLLLLLLLFTRLYKTTCTFSEQIPSIKQRANSPGTMITYKKKL